MRTQLESRSSTTVTAAAAAAAAVAAAAAASAAAAARQQKTPRAMRAVELTRKASLENPTYVAGLL